VPLKAVRELGLDKPARLAKAPQVVSEYAFCSRQQNDAMRLESVKDCVGYCRHWRGGSARGCALQAASAGAIRACPSERNGIWVWREGPGRGRGMPIDLSGDGHAAMLRAGAVLGKLELGSAAIVPWHFFAAPGLEILFGLGGTDIFVNARGERFLSGTDIRRDMRGRSSVGLAIAREMREGRGPVYLDVTGMSAAERRLVQRVIPIVVRNFEAAGFDLGRDRIPYSVVVMSTHSVGGGGAAIDERMATSLPRLYAGGNCTDGAYMSMQQNLTDCAAMGYWAGQNAGEEALENDALPLRETQVERYAMALTQPLRRTGGTAYTVLRERIRDLYATRMGMTIDADRGRDIEAFLDALIRESLPEASATDARSLCRIHGIRNFCETLRAVVVAVLHRTESRGNVLRSDYPMIDNEGWLKYTRVRRLTDGTLKVWDEPATGAPSGTAGVSIHPFFAEGHA
jgi:succinate dehydrogenase/fumarate reductase flavoprotein subunit